MLCFVYRAKRRHVLTQPSQPSLEQYVANRYIYELNTLGYKPTCLNEPELLQSTMDTLAQLNRATQRFKQQTIAHRSSPQYT
jgi:hypothetical protein